MSVTAEQLVTDLELCANGVLYSITLSDTDAETLLHYIRELEAAVEDGRWLIS